MSQTLSRWQSVALGLVVVLALALAGGGLARIAAKQGLWADTVELTVAFPEVHDIAPGTPVRVRGVEAGQVLAIEYPDADGPVTVRLRIDAKLANRLFADASAQVHSSGLLGQKVIAIRPGTSARGPLADGRLAATESPDFTQAAAKISVVADEAAALLKEVRASDGTVAKLLKDDDLYKDLKGFAADARGLAKRAETALGTVETEASNVRHLVNDGKETLRSVKQGTDAVQRLPLVRGYVEDPVAILSRSDCRREATAYNAIDLFEPGTAILTDGGREHLARLAEWIKDGHDSRAEVVIAARHNPADSAHSSASAYELTRKQSEVVIECLKANGAHKTGWISRRKFTAVGLGNGSSSVPEREPLPASYVQLVLFTPAG